MKILGVRPGHDSAAALIIDGKVVADVSEERFTRIKNDSSFPIKAIEYCLRFAGISSEDIDVLAIPSIGIHPLFYTFFEIPVGNLEEASLERKSFFQKIFAKNGDSYGNGFHAPMKHNGIPILPLYQNPFRLSKNCKIVTVEHHLAHAASAAYTSEIKEERALIVTMDGSGDDVSTAMWRFEKGQIKLLKKWGKESSLAWFYANATEGLHWRHGSDEWKLMGLAPYGKPDTGALRGFYPEFENGELVKPHHYESFGRWNDHGANHYHGVESKALAEIVKQLGRENFAAEVQNISEKQAFNLILPWLKKENTRNLLCAGGFFLNVKLNQKLWYSGKLDYQWIYPNAGDGGLPAGAALFAYFQQDPEKKHESIKDMYKGPDFENKTIQKILDDRGLAYEKVENPAKETAQYLSQNLVVAWFQGRMETGPRALGSRSILMSPLRTENKDIINKKIKYREHFRPFAPVMHLDKAHDYLVDYRNSLFMTSSFEVKDEKKSKIPAVVHIDGTARPQLITRAINDRYYDVIDYFGKITGEYVLINTSFNIKGEPIVCHPREAIKCFYDTGIDVLVMGNFILKKPYLKPEKLTT